jgi:hypothetical protein
MHFLIDWHAVYAWAGMQGGCMYMYKKLRSILISELMMIKDIELIQDLSVCSSTILKYIFLYKTVEIVN